MQSKDGAPRSVSSVRRERAAGASDTQPNVASDIEKNCHPGSPAALCARYPFDLSIVMTWNAERKGSSLTNGHHQLVGMQVCTRDKLFLPTAASCPMSIDIMFQKTIYHDFGFGGCTIPVTVKIKNELSPNTEEPFDFVAEVVEPQVSMVQWLGAVRQTVNNFSAGNSVEMVFYARVLTPGVYNLNNFSILVTHNNGLYTFPSQSLVSVIAL